MVFLGGPLIEGWNLRDEVRGWTGILATITFSALYLYTFATTQQRRRMTMTRPKIREAALALAALTVLAAVMIVSVGPTGLAAAPYLAVTAVTLLPTVAAGDVVLLQEGTYYIVSNYGDANSTVRSDIRVQASKLTDVVITHRAAVITLKLVSDKGGEALANTAWSVITPAGDVIKESIGAFPRVVLSEGEYRAIAKNEGKVFERAFKVVNGVDGEIEVVAR